MDILAQLKKILKGKDKAKIVGLSILIALCFVIVYWADNPFGTVKSIADSTTDNGEIASCDFAQLLSSVEGAGKVSVYITYVDEKQLDVQGVIIVAEGAKDINVAMKLQQAAACAYGIGIDKIEVFQMKGVY